jgi:hypothetical protein
MLPLTRYLKPNLEQVEWEGLRTNNILKWGEIWMRRPNIVKDLSNLRVTLLIINRLFNQDL